MYKQNEKLIIWILIDIIRRQRLQKYLNYISVKFGNL